jgi:hypothetical protein
LRMPVPWWAQRVAWMRHVVPRKPQRRHVVRTHSSGCSRLPRSAGLGGGHVGGASGAGRAGCLAAHVDAWCAAHPTTRESAARRTHTLKQRRPQQRHRSTHRSTRAPRAAGRFAQPRASPPSVKTVRACGGATSRGENAA